MPALRIAAIWLGFKRQSSRYQRKAAGDSMADALEESDVLLRLQKARYPFVARAMLPRDQGCAIDIAGIPDPRRTRIALQQERHRPRAGERQRRDKKQKEQPRRAVNGA